MVSSLNITAQVMQVGFLFWPGIVLTARFLRPEKFHWLIVMVVIGVGGGLLFLGGMELEDWALQREISYGPQPPPQELVNRLTGPSTTIAKMLWPVYTAIVSAVWFIIYGVAAGIRRALKKAA